MDLNFEEIRRIQRIEKNTPQLVEIDPDFYVHLSDYLKKKKSDYIKSLKGSTSISLEDARDFENMNRLVNDIYERREKKIILRAIRASRTNEADKSHMTIFEERMFKDIVLVLEKYKSVITDIFDGNGHSSNLVSNNIKDKNKLVKVKKSKEKASKDDLDSSELNETNLDINGFDGEGLNIVNVRIIKDIPSFIGPDKVNYGPFEIDQFVELPKHIVDLLIKRNIAELD